MNQDPSLVPKNIEQHVAAAELTLAPGGVLAEIAPNVVVRPDLLQGPDDVAFAILPSWGHGEKPRFELVEKADGAKKALYAEKADRILGAAKDAGIRQEETFTLEQLGKIDPERAIGVVVGAANKTHLVRADLVEKAMMMRGMPRDVIYETHGVRPVPQFKNGEPNSEWNMVKQLAPDMLPEGDSTELDCKLAVRMQQGWRITSDQTVPEESRIITLERDGSKRVVVQPLAKQDGDPKTDPRYEDNFEAALTLIDEHLAAETGQGLDGKQLIVGENGQYRTIRGLSVKLWALRHGVQTDSVVLGDEAGYTVNHLGVEHVTANRPAAVYAPEFVTIHRMNGKIKKLRELMSQ